MDLKLTHPVSHLMEGIELDLMGGTHPVVVAVPEDTLQKAEQWFTRFHVHHLPIVDNLEDQRLVGIVSTADVVAHYSRHHGADPGSTPLKEIMKEEPSKIAPHTIIRDVIALFASESFQSLPVVDSQGRCVGIITVRDVIRFIGEEIQKASGAEPGGAQ